MLVTSNYINCVLSEAFTEKVTPGVTKRKAEQICLAGVVTDCLLVIASSI